MYPGSVCALRRRRAGGGQLSSDSSTTGGRAGLLRRDGTPTRNTQVTRSESRPGTASQPTCHSESVCTYIQLTCRYLPYPSRYLSNIATTGLSAHRHTSDHIIPSTSPAPLHINCQHFFIFSSPLSPLSTPLSLPSLPHSLSPSISHSLYLSHTLSVSLCLSPLCPPISPVCRSAAGFHRHVSVRN